MGRRQSVITALVLAMLIFFAVITGGKAEPEEADCSGLAGLTLARIAPLSKARSTYERECTNLTPALTASVDGILVHRDIMVNFSPADVVLLTAFLEQGGFVGTYGRHLRANETSLCLGIERGDCLSSGNESDFTVDGIMHMPVTIGQYRQFGLSCDMVPSDDAIAVAVKRFIAETRAINSSQYR